MKKEIFLKRWDGHVVEDWATVVSDDFKLFARQFRSQLKAIADSCNAEVVRFHIGHYDLSAFLQTGDKCCYISYSVPRRLPIDVSRQDPMWGVLYREAEDSSDYHGGQNHFSSLENMDRALCLFMRN